MDCAELLDAVRGRPLVKHCVTVGTDGSQVANWVHDIFVTNSGERHEVVHVNEATANLPISRAKVERANRAFWPVVSNTLASRLGVTLKAIDLNGCERAFYGATPARYLIGKWLGVGLRNDLESICLQDSKAASPQSTAEIIGTELATGQQSSPDAYQRLWRIAFTIVEYVISR